MTITMTMITMTKTMTDEPMTPTLRVAIHLCRLIRRAGRMFGIVFGFLIWALMAI